MRTTLAVDDDVLLAVKARARHEGRTAGAVLSDLARTALTYGPSVQNLDANAFPGFEPFPPGERIVTNELIDQLRDDEAV